MLTTEHSLKRNFWSNAGTGAFFKQRVADCKLQIFPRAIARILLPSLKPQSKVLKFKSHKVADFKFRT